MEGGMLARKTFFGGNDGWGGRIGPRALASAMTKLSLFMAILEPDKNTGIHEWNSLLHFKYIFYYQHFA